MINLTKDIVRRIGDSVLYTLEDLEKYVDQYNLAISEEDLEEYLEDIGVERCNGCGWWFESGELVGEDWEISGFCDSCREEEF
jgi:hypothetical protein